MIIEDFCNFIICEFERRDFKVIYNHGNWHSVDNNIKRSISLVSKKLCNSFEILLEINSEFIYVYLYPFVGGSIPIESFRVNTDVFDIYSFIDRISRVIGHNIHD